VFDQRRITIERVKLPQALSSLYRVALIMDALCASNVATHFVRLIDILLAVGTFEPRIFLRRQASNAIPL